MLVFRFVIAVIVAYLFISAYEQYRIRKSIESIYSIFYEINERVID